MQDLPAPDTDIQYIDSKAPLHKILHWMTAMTIIMNTSEHHKIWVSVALLTPVVLLQEPDFMQHQFQIAQK